VAKSVMDRVSLEEAIDLQKRSYTLLKWLADAIPRGFISFDTAHEYADSAECALAWVREHFDNLPVAARPPARDDQTMRRFANCFASYLETSFDLEEKPGTRLKSPCGCYCPYCVIAVSAPHLRAKRLGRPDKNRAEQLECEVLNQLATSHGLAIGAGTVATLMADRPTREHAALVAYAAQLLRRCEGAYVGPWVLALWRTFAWLPTGSPKQDFELTPEMVFDAETALVERLSCGAV
jgi:hypothetical protein